MEGWEFVVGGWQSGVGGFFRLGVQGLGFWGWGVGPGSFSVPLLLTCAP